MWYSIIKTGDPEIDAQHQNIDRFLEEIDPRDAGAPDLLAKLIDALASHFESEEEIAAHRGYAMTDAHRAEHRRLGSLLAVLRKNVRAGEMDPAICAYTLKGILTEHIREYDRHLCPDGD
jgi:hemerythrin-like metal-binding protein